MAMPGLGFRQSFGLGRYALVVKFEHGGDGVLHGRSSRGDVSR